MTQTERILRAALVFAIKQREYVASPENAEAIADQLTRLNLSGEHPDHYRRAFLVLRQKKSIQTWCRRKDSDFEGMSISRLQQIVDLDTKSRALTMQKGTR